MIDRALIIPGAVFEREHPFTWVEERGRLSTGPDDVYERWRPGAWETKIISDDAAMACHGEGTVKFTVISVHRPPGYQERVFYTRHFTDPEGGSYATNKLHHKVMRGFQKEAEAFPFRYEVIEL